MLLCSIHWRREQVVGERTRAGATGFLFGSVTDAGTRNDDVGLPQETNLDSFTRPGGPHSVRWPSRRPPMAGHRGALCSSAIHQNTCTSVWW